jgi:hypothetical protein
MTSRTKFKVTLEFEVEVKPIAVVDSDTLLALNARRPGKKPGKPGAAPVADPQMLLYPVYEAWAAAQGLLQQEVLKDDALAAEFIREMVRDLTRGQIDSLIDGKYGDPDLRGILKRALEKLPAEDQARLRAEESSQLFDETELVDDSVACTFAGITVRPA